MLATVSALVKAAVARAADDRPGLSFQPRHPRINHVWIAGLQLKIHRPNLIGDEQNLAPRLPAVGCLEHPAVRIRFERVALCRYPNDVRVCRMNPHRSNLPGIVEPDEFPGLTAVGGLVHAATSRDITAHIIRTSAEINYIRIGIGHRDTSGRAQRNLAIGDRNPGRSAVGRAKQSPAGDAHVERLWLRRHASYRRDPSTARRPNQSIMQSVEECRIDAAHHWLTRRRLRLNYAADCNDD